MEKFKEAKGYSELDDAQLFKSIHGYLDGIYKKHFYIAQQKIEKDERKGIFPTQEKYKKECDAVEDIVISFANKLAATDPKEI